MRRVASAVCLILAGVGCANQFLAASGKPLPDDILVAPNTSVVQMSQVMQRCEALAQRPVPFPEEQRIGATSTMVRLDEARRRPGAPDGGFVYDGPWLGLTEAELADVDRELNLLGRGLAAFSGRPTLPWVFGVVDLERPVFIASGGGIVFVSAGLLSRVDNEAQLALVLALGIAHVARRDDVEAYRQALKAECLAGALEPALRNVSSGLAPGFNVDGLTHAQLSALSRTVTRMVAAQGAVEPEHVDLAVPMVAFARYQPAEGARLLEAISPGEGLWRVDGPALARQVEALAQNYARDFRLAAPPSRAADFIKTRAAAR